MIGKRGVLQPVFLVGVMVVVLVGAFFAEVWLRRLRMEAGVDFEFAPYVWATALSNLVLAVILVSLLWYVLRSDAVDLVVALVYFIAGGIVVMNPLLWAYDVRILPHEAAFTFPHGLLVTAGAFFAATGLIGLFLSTWKR